jgi:hypothetical protein
MEASSRATAAIPGPAAGTPGAVRADAPPAAFVATGDATVISGRPSAAGKSAATAEIGRLLEGHSLGPYRLDQFVGGGGMGAVFRALDTTLDRVVAVKVLSRQQSNDEEMLKRFRNEAQSAARLDHENIGRVHAVGSDDGWHYIVFEFIEGTNLRDVIVKEGTFDLARTIDVTIQVADALEHASQREVVHRDIKPSNIIITPAGRARVVDMGLARLHHMAGDQDLTVSGMTLGTFDYISPEQARDPRSADVRSDLYSLGCTVFFMLVGRPPFADGTMVQKLLQHQQDLPPAIEALRPDVPKRFAQILGRLMEKNPKDRYQRPADLVADLTTMADDLGIELASPRPAAASSVETIAHPATSVHLPWLIPLLGLVAVVGGLWLRTTGTATQRPGTGSPTGQGLAAVEAVAGDHSADGPAPAEPTAVAEPSHRIWRVVDVPAVDDDCGTVGEAVRQASDGDIIEIACAEPRDDGPFTIDGKRLTIRAADGIEPTLRCGESGAVPRDGSFCTVVAGTLELQDLTVRSAFLPAGGGRPALIAMRGSATMVCEGVTFVVPGEASAAGVCVRSERDAADRQEIRTNDTRVEGCAAFLESKGGGRIDLFWSGGRVVTPGRFLVAEGAPRSHGSGAAIRMTLEDGLFACGDGFACLLDSPSLPLAPRLQALAKECRFLVPDGRAVLEQSGIGDPEAYRPAIEWIDAASRYEGSGVLRRIDGAAERFEIDFASQPQPMNHSPRIDGWPGED